LNFLLDTNVASEWTKPLPNPGIVKWLAEADEDRLFLSVATLAELRYGIERLAQGARRSRLELWLSDELMPRFEHRILTVEERIADSWGRVMAKSEARGRRMQAMDGMLAATALTLGFTLVTRNVGDFETAGCLVVNPWS
jgi:toxin FitB